MANTKRKSRLGEPVGAHNGIFVPVSKTHQPTCFGEDLGCWYSINSTGELKEKSGSG